MIIYNVWSQSGRVYLDAFLGVPRTPWLITFGTLPPEDFYGREHPGPTIIDSGAFLVYTDPKKAKKINLESYAEFLEGTDPSVPAFTFDVIGDADASWKNWLWLRERFPDREILPVWHLGTDRRILDRYLAVTDYIALGGMAVIQRRTRSLGPEHVDPAWRVFREHWPVRVHGLGITAEWALRRYPWRSVDSSSWTVPVTYLHVLRGQQAFSSVLKKGPERIDQVAEIMAYRRHSLLPEEAPHLSSGERRHSVPKFREWRAATMVRCLELSMQIQDRTTALWRRRGVEWHDDRR